MGNKITLQAGYLMACDMKGLVRDSTHLGLVCLCAVSNIYEIVNQ